MTSTGSSNLIRLQEVELDLPVFRIYDLNRFEAMLTSNQDALVNPSKWEDPFENFFLERTEVFDTISRAPIPLKNLAQDWYGQCWSFNEETDAMWRIYSPDPKARIGVKVSTTIRRLFQNLQSVGSSAPDLQFFVGRVAYLTQQEITNLMQDLTFSDVTIGGRGDKFANLLCIKREAFSHENEVRLIFQDIDLNKPKHGSNGVFRYKVDPNTLFDEVKLDPRLTDDLALRLEAKLKAIGCNLPIEKSLLYQTPEFVIPFQ